MRRLISVAVLAGAMAVGGAAAPASANVIGDSEGCTPGYWKNHTETWQANTPPDDMPSPTRTVGATFTGATSVTADKTLAEALEGGGGPGAAGAERILMRAAVAAFLNAGSDELEFPWRRNGEGLDGRPALVQAVNDAIASGDRETMLDLAERLDADNNLGCPLS